MEFTAIAKVGIELEGGWTAMPATTGRRVGDASVQGLVATAGTYLAHQGEFVSAPMETPAEVEAWVAAAYPQVHNATCGMHVHASFKSRTAYARLMTPAFFDYFTRRMEAWGHRVNLPATHAFWNRLNGFNRYCRKNFVPDQQAWSDQKYRDCRYAQLNFCFKLHGTIECRLFPVFKQPRIAALAIAELVSIYEDWLRDTNNQPMDVVETTADLV